MQNYIVLEITRNAQGNIAVYPSAKEQQASAEKKYYEILERATDSNSPEHSAVILGFDGFFIERRHYHHDVTPPEPEPESEPESSGE